jgi:MSHA biogenesis protein MshL
MTRRRGHAARGRPVAAAAHLVASALLLLGLGGCALEPDRLPSVPGALPTPALSATLSTPAPPPAIPAAPPATAAAVTRFDLRVDDLPAAPFFVGLARASGRALVVHPEVTGRLSLDLQAVSLDEALALIRDVYGYEHHHIGATTVISPARLQARIFEVDYLNVERHGRSLSSVGVAPAPSTGGAHGARRAGGDDALHRGGAIETRTSSDVWGQLQDVLERLVGRGDGREVVIDRHAGLAVVRAMPAELRDVADYLAQVHAHLTRQVILEARILEVTLADDFQTGIDWALLGRQATRLVAVGAGVQAGRARPPEPGAEPDAAGLAALPAGFAGEIGGLLAAGLIAPDFAAVLRLLATQGEVRVLSSPRVATLSNQKAVIKVGNNAYFVTDVSTSAATLVAADGSRVRGGFDLELSPFFSGISLDVTPHVGRDGHVTLHVHPSVTEVVDQTRTLLVGGEAQSLPLAYSTLREADAVIRAHDGEVVVIGGLMQEREATLHGRIPFFSRIPLLGGLFRHERREQRRTELVILLQPTLVPTPAPGHPPVAPGGPSHRRRRRPDTTRRDSLRSP